VATRVEKAHEALSKLSYEERLRRAGETTNVQEQLALARNARNSKDLKIRIALAQNAGLNPQVQLTLIRHETNKDVLQMLIDNPASTVEVRGNVDTMLRSAKLSEQIKQNVETLTNRNQAYSLEALLIVSQAFVKKATS
jgi:hypothetical protein